MPSTETNKKFTATAAQKKLSKKAILLISLLTILGVKIELLFLQRKQARGAIYGNYAHVVEHLNV
jgi:hypothetical protein